MTTATTDLYALSVTLGKATHYTDIFLDQNTVREDYRRWAVDLHPDKYSGNDKGVATEAFHLLSVFKAEALQMAQEGRWGERQVLATIKTKKAIHEVKRRLGEGDLSNLYRAMTKTTDGASDSIIKVAKSPKDNDLLAQEARVLKKLHKEDNKLNRHLPVLLDTFVHSEGRRRANAFEYLHGWYTLEDVKQAYPNGLDPRHGVWMFRRLLMALGLAHDHNIVHGAVVPTHVLISPEDHGVMLVDWCYSVVIDAQSNTEPAGQANFIKAVVPMYKDLYPTEVGNKEAASAATDIYMAATLMNWLMPIAPKALRAWFKGCALTKQNMRPDNVWLLLEEFDDLLKRIGEPFYPKRFVEFTMPTGLVYH